MRSLGVELVHEGVEAGLLLEAVAAWRAGGFLLQGQVHALVAAVLLGTAWLDAFDGDAEPKPPDRELGEVEQSVGTGEGDEWFSRPADERFLSLSGLFASVRGRAERSRILARAFGPSLFEDQRGRRGQQNPPRKFVLIDPRSTPKEALTWNGWKQRAAAMYAWRRAVFHVFGARGSVMRVAWVLSDLFPKHGYAFASDGYLSKETFLSRRHVQEAIAALANAGAICRAHVPGKKTERRIFPSSKIL
jgi:hypothetical protein